MRHEKKKEFRIHRDVIIDSLGAFNASKGLCRPSNSSCIQGYIQNVELVPFSITFFSDIQVNSFLILRNVNQM